MSFILDALRKSEIERQQQSDGEFALIPNSKKDPRRPIWIWVVGGLLVVNLFVLGGLWMRSNSSSPSVAPASLETHPETDLEMQPPPIEKVAVEKKPASFAQRIAAAPRIVATDVAQERPTAREKQPITAEVVAAEPQRVSARDVYPTLQTLRANGRTDLPDLHLDIHVYSDATSDRFVFINMSKYREGAQLDEGPVVSEITPDGVILGHLGQYFVLPRE